MSLNKNIVCKQDLCIRNKWIILSFKLILFLQYSFGEHHAYRNVHT